jgi:alpha-tubulin suppressor-like RCC1 family protein
MRAPDLRSTAFRAAFASACLLLSASPFAQGPGMTIAPVNPTIAVGQRQPFTVTGAVAPVNVSGGGEYTCAAMSDGTARCAGRNQFGQLGDGSWTNQSLPVAPGGLVSVARAVAGDEFSCALLSDGTAKCWGLGEKGQRGDGTFDQIALTPVAVQGVHNAIALSAGYNHACALLGDRTLRCWGSNANGQLGDPSTPGSAVPIPVPGLGGVQAIAAGAFHTCALMADTTVRCWGANANGQLGDGTMTDAPTPVGVNGLSNVTAIAAGSSHTCALVADGSLRCWGDGYLGQLGDGTDTPSTAPVAVSGIGSAVEIVAGWAHTCARLADGGARCWGEGTAGQLGNGATRSSTTPVPVAGIATAVGLTAGWWHHSCALLAGGDVRCWGGNDWGQFGNGTTAASATPVSMTGLAVTWTSSDTTIVSIDTAGQATGLKPGVVTVTARDIGGASASTTLAVQPARHTLTVTKTGSAQGFASVTSTPAGISCDSTCAAEFDAGTVVTLVASPGPLLMSWAGCDSASGNSCTVTMSAARSVTARFVGMQP